MKNVNSGTQGRIKPKNKVFLTSLSRVRKPWKCGLVRPCVLRCAVRRVSSGGIGRVKGRNSISKAESVT
jgi:hypothetical protein